MRTVLTVLAIACSTLVSPAADTAKVSKPIPKLSELLPGSSLPNTTGKVVLVDFWASWCGPCKASFPAFNRLQEKYADKGLVIIGIGVDDDPAKYKEFSGKMGAKFPLVHDSGKKAAEFFNPPAMPSSYIADRKGIIRHIHTGFRGAETEAAYLKEVEALLAEK